MSISRRHPNLSAFEVAAQYNQLTYLACLGFKKKKQCRMTDGGEHPS